MAMKGTDVMRSLTRAVPYVTLVALALTNSACASKKEYDASVARGDSLQTANVRLQAEYDSLQNLFATEMEAASLDMQLLRDGIEIELPADLLFESGSLEVKRDGREFGMKLADYLKGNDYLVFVTGYTDSQNPIGNLARRYPTPRRKRSGGVRQHAGGPREEPPAAARSSAQRDRLQHAVGASGAYSPGRIRRDLQGWSRLTRLRASRHPAKRDGNAVACRVVQLPERGCVRAIGILLVKL
jgi:hypothetical protein